MLRVIPIGTKGNLRDNVSFSLLEIRTLLNFTHSHPKLGLSSTKAMGPVSKVLTEKVLIQFATLPSKWDQKS